MTRKKMKAPPAWMVDGAAAHYHSRIGGPPTKEVALLDAPFQSPGGWVVFVAGVSGYVACEALSPRAISAGGAA